MKKQSRNIKKKIRKNKIKINGGGFTGHELYELFYTFLPEYTYTGTKESELAIKNLFERLSIQNIQPLDITNTDLYNDRSRVLYIYDETNETYVEPYNIRFIIIHVGTDINSWFDIGNNLRNLSGFSFLGTGMKSVTTQRNITSNTAHEKLAKYLIDLFTDKTDNNKLKSEFDNDNTPKYQKHIINIIAERKKKVSINNESISNKRFIYINSIRYAVEELLRNTLTTLGHSQGAVYAYIYGNQGKETIVVNPAPYTGPKPDNVYIIRREYDPVSAFTTHKYDVEMKFRYPEEGYVSDKYITLPSNKLTHTILTLKDNHQLFGNKFLYNKQQINKNDNDTHNDAEQKSTYNNDNNNTSEENMNDIP